MWDAYNEQNVLSSPLISVIIIAHRRKEFLLRAVESVLKQELEANTFEILVIKNFENDDIDSFLFEKGILNILSKKQNLGGKMSEAIEKSKGKIISFLEDDDYFLPGKLGKVADIFLNEPDIVYFHNSALEITQNGEKTGRIVMSLNTDITLNANISFVQLMTVLKKKAHGNNSCISIKRELAEILSSHLTLLNVRVDGFILLCALEMKKKLKFSTETFTAYTLHESFTHLETKDYEDYVRANAKKSSIMFEEQRIESLFFTSEIINPPIKLATEYFELKEKLNLNLFSENVIISVRDIAKYLYLCIQGRRYTGVLGAMIHTFSLLSKGGARKVSYLFNK